MSHLDQEKMDHLDQISEGDWQGIDQTTDDPEEARVMFCALDSFLSVYFSFSFSPFTLRCTWPPALIPRLVLF